MGTEPRRVEAIGRGSVVAVESPPTTPRAADRNILTAADASGVYSPSAHREQARERLGSDDADAYVRSHVRRLEALRRAGIVERIHAEHWTVPADLPERGLAHDRQRNGPGPRIDELSHLSLDRQVRHEGATWLDRTMLGQDRQALANAGFGGDVQTAWNKRREMLAERGYITPQGEGRYRGPRDLIQRLEASEIDRAGRKFAAERGLVWQPSGTGEHVSGKLVGQAQLASGRFAMIDSGMGFQLVPWSDPLEKRLGQQISGVAMPGGGMDWSFGRSRRLGILAIAPNMGA